MQGATLLRVSENMITSVYVVDKLILLGYQDGTLVLISRQSYSSYEVKLGSGPVLHITKAFHDDEYIVVALEQCFIISAVSLLSVRYRKILKNYKRLTCVEPFQNYYIIMQLTDIELFYPVFPKIYAEYNESLPGYRLSVIHVETEKTIMQSPIHACGGTFKLFGRKIFIPCSIAMEGFLYYQYGLKTRPKVKEMSESSELELIEDLVDQKPLIDWLKRQRSGDFSLIEAEVPELQISGMTNICITLNYLNSGKTATIKKQQINIEDGRIIGDAEMQRLTYKNGVLRHKRGGEITLDCAINELLLFIHGNALIACQEGVCAQFTF